jgi:hypothetical protein
MTVKTENAARDRAIDLFNKDIREHGHGDCCAWDTATPQVREKYLLIAQAVAVVDAALHTWATTAAETTRAECIVVALVRAGLLVEQV